MTSNTRRRCPKCTSIAVLPPSARLWTKISSKRHFPFGFRTQNVGVECGDFDSRTMPTFALAAKKASMTSHCSRGRGHCLVTQYFVPGTRSISCRTPRSGGS
ncbi:hypothetical protein Plhal710r2_c087g0182701 [Plasmopara halstedii]